MISTPKIEKARETATRLHQGQKRKDGISPYIVHPLSVVTILEKYTKDEDTICAAWLHDTLEDSKEYDYERLEQDFGKRIAGIVKEVSEDKDPCDSREKKMATWKERKLKGIENIKNNSHEALMVHCAGKIHNLRSSFELFKKEGEILWEPFNAPEPKKESEMWHHQEMLKALKANLDNDIVKEYEEVVKQAKKVIINN